MKITIKPLFLSDKYNKIKRPLLKLFSKKFKLKMIFFRFMVSGGMATLTQVLSLSIFYKLFDLNIIISTTLAFLLAFTVSFNLQKFWTFKDFRNSQLYKQLYLYFTVSFINLIVNGFLMHFMVNELSLFYIFSQILVSGFIGVYSFLVYKFLIFKQAV